MKLHRYVDHQRLHIVTKDVISLSISVLLLFRHYISHKITFGAPSSGGVLRSACGAFIYCLFIKVLLSLATFSHGLSRYAVTEARRRATVCHGWFYVSSQPATFCWDLSQFVSVRSSSATSIKFCQGFLR